MDFCCKLPNGQLYWLEQWVTYREKRVPKSAYRSTPKVVSGYLYTNDTYTGTVVNTPAWFAWLRLGQTFYYETKEGAFTARCEQRRNGSFWYAFRRLKGHLHKRYLGAGAKLTSEVLDKVAAELSKSSLSAKGI